VRPGEHLSFYLRCALTWHHSIGIPVERLFHLKLVRVGALPAKFTDPHRSADLVSGMIRVDVEPGEHEIEFIVEFAYAATADLVGLNTHRALPDDWPTGIKRWTASVKTNLTVLGPNDRPVTPVTDPSLQPLAGQHIKVKNCLTRMEAGKLKLIVTLEAAHTPVPVSFDVVARVDGKAHPMREMTYHFFKNRHTSSGMQ